MKSHARIIRITPQKAGLIAGMIKGKSAEEALSILQYIPKKGAKILYKVLASAVANATNNFKQEKSVLYVKQILIGKGPTLKRNVPVSRGRAYPIDKKTSNISILLGISQKTEQEKSTTKKITKAKDEKREKTSVKIKAKKMPEIDKDIKTLT